MSKLGKFAAACAAVVCAFGAMTAWAGEMTWQGAAGGDWSVGTNWSTGETPTADDDVFLNKGADVVAVAGVAAKSITLTDATLKIGSSADRTPFTAEISGSLTLNGASKLYVYAKTFSDLSVFASYEGAMAAIWANASVVEIGGTFDVNGTSVMYPDNDPLTGTPVLFKARDFVLASGAKVDLHKRGWNSYKYTGKAPANTCDDTWTTRYTYAFSAGWSYQGGGGYGGKGGNCKGKATYGFDYAPFLPGSPNGGHKNPYRGPGSFCGFFSGNMQLDGKIDASGDGDMYSATSGGGVWLTAKTMTVAQAASITANGGNITGGYGSMGGGGRISLAFGVDESVISKLAAGETPDGLSYGNLFGMNATAAAGKRADGYTSSGAGTMTVVANKSVSQPLQITAEPVEYENGRLVPNYGFYAYEADAVPTLTAPEGTYPEVYQGCRRLVNNGAVTNDEAAIRSVTWKWEGEECLVRLRPCGGTITANGADYTEAAEVWLATGTELTLRATPSGEASFVRWVGDLQGMTSEEATLVVTVDQALTIDALFSDATGVTKTFVGASGGFWQEPANWEPAGIPTVVDDVVLNGKTVYCSGVLAVNSLTMTGGTLAIGGKGTTVEAQAKATDYYVPWTGLYVPGNVSIAGAGLSLGARRTGYTCFGAVIGGNLTVTGASKAAFYAPETDSIDPSALYASAMKVKVGGTFQVLDTATVFTEVDGFTGTPVKFEVAGDVTVAEKAKLSADGRGWHWYERSTLDLTKFTTSQIHTEYNKTIVSVSLGCGSSYTVGGTYGLGEPTDTSSRQEFGYLYAPFLSGGACGGYDTSNRAGGQIWVETPGTLTLDGTVTAVPSTGGSTRSSSSGGGIWLCAKKLAAGETAKLIANGGNSSGGSSTTAGGTGGRISVAIGVSAENLVALAHGELPEDLAYSEDITACSTSVKGGEGQKVGGYMVYAPKGTVSTVIGEASEYDLRIMGSPLEAVQDGLEYHVEKVTVGSTWSQTLQPFGYDPSAPNDVRYSLVGWVISNTTEEVARGTDATATFTVGKGPFTVTWLWNNRETLTRLTPNDPTLGGVSVNGGEATPTPDAWSSDAASITVRAVPNAGAEFLYWYGDVPFESATKETLTFDTAEPFGVLPVFRKVAEPTNYVWQVADGKTGNWEDAANWMPTNVPGPADTVTIASGTCVASNYAACAALNLSGKGALKVGAAASTLLKEAVLVVSGDVTLTNSAALAVNDPYGSYLRHMRMTVGGNLTLMDKATLQLGAGPTNGVDITLATGGGWVTVGGAMTLDGTAKVTAKGDPWTGGTVVFRVGSLTVGEGATMSAVGGGYRYFDTFKPVCYAPSYGYAHGNGGGYGGRGRDLHNTWGQTYGSALAPIHGGSCMGDYRMGNEYRGGGLIRVHATGGMTLNGLFDADCYNRTYNNSSGGGIWLTAGDRIRVGETAVFRARGGTGATTGIGGGGRISVCQFISPERADRMALDGEYHGVGKAAKHVFGRDEFRAAFSLPETAINLSDGKNTEAEPYGGSFTYIDGTPSGLMLIAR